MSAPLTDGAREALERARRERRPLLEPEVYELVRALGVAVPMHRFLPYGSDLRSVDLERFSSDRIVVKVVGSGLRHKTDVGGVDVVPKEHAALQAATERMERTVGADHQVEGVLLCELVDHDRSLGSELLLGLHWSNDFGAVVTLGPGGTDAERLADQLEEGRAAAIFSPALPDRVVATLDRKIFLSQVCRPYRGQPARFDRGSVERLLTRALNLSQLLPHDLGGFEINPLVSTVGGLVALDALAWPGGGEPAAAQTRRPIPQIRHLLEPRSIAVVGVSSTRMNPGRVVVHRLRAAGYDGRLMIVKPGIESLDGYPCVPNLEALDRPVDLLVLSLPAPQAVASVEESVALAAAQSVLLISGGFEERAGNEELGERVRSVLATSRAVGQPAPVVNGGNCLGVRSEPGRVDTLFITQDKLPLGPDDGEPLAVIAQSGAFAIARQNRWGRIRPRYLVTVGNQVDLTVGDYLTYLADDPTVGVFACYVEGFQPLDGRRFLQTAEQLHRDGRVVVLYLGGRTTSGAAAAASHTAAVCSSYRSARELAEVAGILVAESLDEFTDLVQLFCLLRDRKAHGRRLGALSNAGFECVTMADAAVTADLDLASMSETTSGELRSLLRDHGLEGIITVRNPLDVTPMLDDEGLASAARLIIADDTVDVAVIGCVPHTDTLDTLSPLSHRHAIAQRLAELFTTTAKPWVAVVDAGSLYDPMVEVLEAARVPVFRTSDRAVRALGRFVAWHVHAVSL